MISSPAATPPPFETDSPYAVVRLFITLVLMVVGSSGMYVIAVVLPAVQSEFGVARGVASMPYTLAMIGFGIGGMLMGKLADRFGVMLPLLIGAVCLGIGFIYASMASNIIVFMLVHGLVIGLCGSSATFSPLLADTSLWFVRRRGIAVAVCASGNYLGGVVWPPVAQHFVDLIGWRQTYSGLGVTCFLIMAGLAPLMRRRPPRALAAVSRDGINLASERPFGLPMGQAQLLLCVAGVACCVAMAMPQVHLVAYCGDLGYGAVRGAQMLSLMMACGVMSRLISGFICDRIGGLRTMLLGSILQGLALLLFLPFDGMVSLYVISAMFGLFQGGIVPSYAIIVREYFPASQAGGRVGSVIMCTMLGMALGGWMSGQIFDLTGSYHAAFGNGILWNLLNFSIGFFLLRRTLRKTDGSGGGSGRQIALM